MPSFFPARPDVVDLVADVMGRHHPLLIEAGVRVNVLMAWAKRGDAVKLHGYPCLATIKVNGARDRIEGKADATMVIDSEAWEEDLDDERRVALIDHELTHLVPVEDEPLEVEEEVEGQPGVYRKVRKRRFQHDDAGRPKLRMRLHDWQLGGFAEIAERHGPAAAEVEAFRRTSERYRQQLFAWTDDMAPQHGAA